MALLVKKENSLSPSNSHKLALKPTSTAESGMNNVIEVFRELTASPELFREHIQNTARQTGFRGGLVEKDFYCSVILSRSRA